MLLHKRILPYEIDVPLLTLHLFAQLSTTLQWIFKRNNTQIFDPMPNPALQNTWKEINFILVFFSFVEPCMCILAFVPYFNLTNWFHIRLWLFYWRCLDLTFVGLLKEKLSNIIIGLLEKKGLLATLCGKRYLVINKNFKWILVIIGH